MSKLTDASFLAGHPTPHSQNTIGILDGAVWTEIEVSGVVVQSQALCSEKQTSNFIITTLCWVSMANKKLEINLYSLIFLWYNYREKT